MPDNKTDNDIYDEIEKTGQLDDKDINLGATALLMSSIYHPDVSLMNYHVHLDQLVVGTKARFDDLVKEGSPDDNATRLAALKYALIEQNSYKGDMETAKDIANGDIIAVIDRRKGLPTTIGLLFIHVCRVLGWEIEALSFPANLILRLKKESDLLIFDPFNDCRVLQASDLRALLKTAHGDHAELSSNFYAPLSNKALLTGIFNFLKLKQIEAGDYDTATKTVEMLMRLDPKEYRLYLDAGVLYSRTGRPQDAIQILEKYLDTSPSNRDRQEAAILIQRIKQSLN